VPFKRAEELERFVRQLGSPVETEYMSNERHILSPMAAIAALQRSLGFFKEHLKNERSFALTAREVTE